MKRQSRILAGTALGLLMASAPLSAAPLKGGFDGARLSRNAFVLAQVDCQEGESAEACAARQAAEKAAPAEEAAPERKQRRERKPAEESAPAAEPQAEQPAPQAQPEAAPAEEAAPKPRRDRKQKPAEAEQPAEQAAPQAQPEAAPAEAPAEEATPKPRRDRKQKPAEAEQPAPEAAPAEQTAPQVEQPAPQAQPEAAPAEEAAPKPNRERKPKPVEAEQPAQQAEPAPGKAPTPEAKPDTPAPEQAPVPEAAPAAPANDNGTPAQPAPEATQPAQQQPEAAAPVDPNAGPNAAPILDSQKEAPRQRPRRDGQKEAQPAQPLPAPVDQGPPPESDKAATEAAQPEKVQPVTQEKGRRVERAPDDANFRRRERPEGLDVLKEIGDRVILRFGDQISVESNDRPRMTRGAQEVYYEDLPRNRTRETIVRENGVQIVTIRDEYGDVIRRSRITPDGREYVLSYVDERNYDRVRDRRDPGLDLPPMRLTIPVDEYILNADRVDDPEEYYDFLEQPPVERVQRLYSIDEVKRSARVRDIARRVDLDTLTFEFGSAVVPESQIAKLEGVANAMEKLLAKNPAETFLIEGHTDAVGSDEANLALSDRRAEAVADALTNVFAIPPENLATQGYGERYLKVKTEKPEQENRRVGIRRITPLVAPVASAN